MVKLIIKKHAARPLLWWYSMRNNIDFEPPYQRRENIWSIGDRAYLIDSILNGYDIPKFYLADFRLGSSLLNIRNKMYAIIDGKQRFGAIFDFFSDKLEIGKKRRFIYEKDISLNLNGLRYSELKARYPRIAMIAENYEIDAISVWADKEGPIEQLFVRLNTSLPVAGIERRNAIPGLVMELTRALSKHSFFKDKIKFSIKRMAELNAANKLLWLEFNGKLAHTKKRELDHFAEAATGQEDFDTVGCRKAAARVKMNLKKMSEVFCTQDLLLSSSGVIPIYYWFIKNMRIKDLGAVRDFLYEFEKRRKENARKKEEGQSDVDNELLLFDKQRRSPNDAKAMEIMFDILSRYFKNR